MVNAFEKAELKRRLHVANSYRRFTSIMLLAPLLIFTTVFFVMPILGLLTKAIHSPEFHDAFPLTVAQLDRSSEFDEAMFKALFEDLDKSNADNTIGKATKRLNQDETGFVTMVKRVSRASEELDTKPASYRDWFLAADKRWGEEKFQQAIRRAASSFTDLFLLNAVDARRDEKNSLSAVAPDEALFLNVFGRTLWISFVVTITCVILGFPVAWTIAHVSAGWRNFMLACVLLPFWTSLLVRTAGWIIVLQKNGPINEVLQFVGIIDAPLQLIFNRFGVFVALTHIMLPFIIMPLYGVMKGIRPDYMRAAKSLGARPIMAFFKVYIPMTLPGIKAGSILVFILSMGYYITPALVGGPRDQMVSYFIAFYTNSTINWGLASALALNLLVVTLILYAVYQKLLDAGQSGGRV